MMLIQTLQQYKAHSIDIELDSLASQLSVDDLLEIHRSYVDNTFEPDGADGVINYCDRPDSQVLKVLEYDGSNPISFQSIDSWGTDSDPFPEDTTVFTIHCVQGSPLISLNKLNSILLNQSVMDSKLDAMDTKLDTIITNTSP